MCKIIRPMDCLLLFPGGSCTSGAGHRLARSRRDSSAKATVIFGLPRLRCLSLLLTQREASSSRLLELAPRACFRPPRRQTAFLCSSNPGVRRAAPLERAYHTNPKKLLLSCSSCHPGLRNALQHTLLEPKARAALLRP